jgi:hypothetical protein
MVEILSRDASRNVNTSIKIADYERFCMDYTWMALQGLKFGAEFCRRFSIDDISLSTIHNTEYCKRHIQLSGYVK